jgi:hypothetical protein
MPSCRRTIAREQTMPERTRRAALVLFIAWAVLFVFGAAGELLGIEMLSRITDLKGLFLR